MSVKRWLKLTLLLAAGTAGGFARAQIAGTTAPTALDPAAALKEPSVSPSDREEAAKRLLQVNTPGARQAVNSALQDISNRKGQLAAARALATYPDPDPQFIIPLGALIGSDAQLSQAAIEALTNYRGNGDVRARLIDVARSNPNEPARLAAIAALGGVCDKPSSAALVDLLSAEAEPATIHRAAAAALIEMTGLDQNGRNAARWQQWWAANAAKGEAQFQNELLMQRAARASLEVNSHKRLADEMATLLRKLYADAPDANKESMLLEYLGNAGPAIRSVGAALVANDFGQGRLPTPAVKEKLRGMVNDSDSQVRVSVAKALAAINYPAAFDALLAQLAVEKDDAARSAQLDAIVAKHDLRAVDALLKLLRDPSPAIAEVAADGLKELAPVMRERDPKLAEKVAKELRDVLGARGAAPDEVDVRAALVDAMAPLRNPELRGTFMTLVRPSEPVPLRRAGLRALGMLGEIPDQETADIIVEWLEDPDASIRLEAVGALESAAKFEQAEKLYERIKPDIEKDDKVRERAWTVLSSLFPQASADILFKWAERFRDDPERRLLVLLTLRDKLVAEKNLSQLAQVQQNIGEEQMKLQQYEPAIAAFDAALGFYRNKNENLQYLDQLLTQKMEALLVSKQYDKAATFAAETISSSPQYQTTMGPLIKGKIDSLRNSNQLDEAKQLIDAANKMNPPLAEPSLSLIKAIEDDVKKKLAGRPKQSGIAPSDQSIIGSGN